MAAWVANKDFSELELRTSPNFRTSFFVEIANFTELQNFFQQFSKDAAFWKNPEKNWLTLAKIQQNFGKICELLENIDPLVPKDMFRLVFL